MIREYSLPLLLFVQVVTAFVHKSENGVTVQYDITYNNLCYTREGKYSMQQGLSVVQCVEECGLRRNCAALTYKRRSLLCELFLSAEHDNLRPGDCIFINATDIEVIGMPCGDCEHSQKCDTLLETCVYEECIEATSPERGELVGNCNAVDAMVKYMCTSGYRVRNGVTNGVCLETGQWNAAAECEMDCEYPPSVDNGNLISLSQNVAIVACDEGYQSTNISIYCNESSGSWDTVRCDRTDCGEPYAVFFGTVELDAVDGTYFLDTATVTCDAYPTETVVIECTSEGIWETANCEDCYPTSGMAYTGKTNRTIEGRQCQRWDSQYPHPHIHTDLKDFPEVTLAAVRNYCRSPSGDFDPWCMTTDPGKEWEYCDVQKCPST